MELTNKLYKAIGASISGRLLSFLIQFALTLIYARIFSPQEFGVIASISVFVIFFQMLSDMGIGPALINVEKITDEFRNGIFSFTIISAFILSISFYLISPLIGYFYGEHDYKNISLIISIAIFFNTITILPIAAMNKDAIFFKVAIGTIVFELLTLFFVIKLYDMGFGVEALASRITIVSIFRFFFLWYFSKYTSLGRAYIGKNISSIKIIYKFSTYQFLFNFINYFSRNLDNILVGKFFGMSQLGFYDKAYNLMRYPLTLTTFAMAPAIQPILVNYRYNVEAIYKYHEELAARTALITSIISVFMFLNSELLVGLLLGNTWVSIAPIVKIFALSIPIQAIGSCSGSFYQVLDKTKALFFSGIVTAIINCSGMLVGISFGSIYSLSISVVVSFTVSFVVNNFIMSKLVYRKSMKHFYYSILLSLTNVIAPIALYSFIKWYWLNDIIFYNSLYEIFVNIFVGILSLSAFYKKIKSGLLIYEN